MTLLEGRSFGILSQLVEVQMRSILLGFLLFSSTAGAVEFSSDVRSDRTGSLELVYGTNLSMHFVGTQFYVSDALLVRLLKF